MNPLGTRARAEELARLLDGAVAGPGVLTTSQLTLATRLRAVAPSLDALAMPRPEFRAQLRQRLLAVATVQASIGEVAEAGKPSALDAAVSWTQSRKAQRRIGVLAGSMAGVVAISGVGLASSRSLPGAPFYGLKRAAEGVELSFASGDTARGSKHLEFAATRLREVGALARGEGQLALGAATDVPSASGLAFGGSTSARIVSTLAAFNGETQSGARLLQSAYRATGKSEPLAILTSFASTQQDALRSLIDSLPADTLPSAQTSLELVFDVGSEAKQQLALGACGGECFPGNAGPTLPAEPEPTPGATADPTPTRVDTNGVPDCQCSGPSPTPAPAPAPEPTGSTPSPTPSPTSSASPAPSASPSSTPTSAPGPLPTAVTTLLPSPVVSLIPTLPPLPVPLPAPVPTVLPTLAALPPQQ